MLWPAVKMGMFMYGATSARLTGMSAAVQKLLTALVNPARCKSSRAGIQSTQVGFRDPTTWGMYLKSKALSMNSPLSSRMFRSAAKLVCDMLSEWSAVRPN
jgi:hypothetical protein